LEIAGVQLALKSARQRVKRAIVGLRPTRPISSGLDLES
jgi:hypothetical protein